MRLNAWTTERWCCYFKRQERTLLSVPWHFGADLNGEEFDLVAASVQEFQQGEGLEGGHFFRCAEEYGRETGDWGYVEAHRRFMAEEKRHAHDLGRFLDLAGIPRLTERSWLNRAFCWVGSRGRLAFTLGI